MANMNRDFGKGTPGENHERVSLAGCLLAAHPSVGEPLFAKAVCLVVEHTQDSTVGIMLNRPLAIDPNPFWSSLFQGAPQPQPTAVQGHFNFGGPHNGPILAIHNDSQLAEGGNSQGVYLSAQVETLQKLAVLGPEHLRWFIGNATWPKTELEQQVIAGMWYVVPAMPQIVFAEEAKMWPEAIQWVGQSVLASFPGVNHFPTSPSAN